MSLHRKTFLIALLLFISYIAISIRIGTEGLGKFDEAVTNYIQAFISGNMTKIMIIFTTIGSYKVEYPVLVITACILWRLRKNFVYPIVLIINLAGVRLFNQLLKAVYERPRPAYEHLVEASGYSFPSGHAMISSGFYGFISYLLFYLLKEKTNNAIFAPIFFSILILLIGISRIYLGVHYPSDVIAGFLMGGLWLIFCILLFYYRQHIFFKKRKLHAKG